MSVYVQVRCRKFGHLARAGKCEKRILRIGMRVATYPGMKAIAFVLGVILSISASAHASHLADIEIHDPDGEIRKYQIHEDAPNNNKILKLKLKKAGCGVVFQKTWIDIICQDYSSTNKVAFASGTLCGGALNLSSVASIRDGSKLHLIVFKCTEIE